MAAGDRIGEKLEPKRRTPKQQNTFGGLEDIDGKMIIRRGPYEISAGGSTTNTSRNQNLCPQVSVSTSSSTSLEIVRDTEEAEVNELGSQNQRTHFFFK